MANYPSSDPTNDSLHTAVNNLSTGLNGAIDASQTTITVNDTAGFPSVGAITIDAERISYTGITATEFTGCTRGFGGTTAVSHADATPVKLTYGAEYHNDLRDEVIAVASDLRDSFEADLDDSVAAAATATDVKERLDQIVTQIKAIISGTDWKDVPSDTLNGISSELVAIQSDLNDAVTPAASAADLSTRLNHIATQLKNITGEADWKTVPQVSTSNLNKNVQNILVNGGINVWQRGVSFPNAGHGAWTADMWKSLHQSSTHDISRESTETDNAPFALKQVVTANNGGYLRLTQELGAPSQYTGKILTLSVRVKSDVNAGIHLVGGASNRASTHHTGDNTWQTLTVSITCPIPTANVSISLGWFPDLNFVEISGLGTAYYSKAMLTISDQPIDFVPEDPAIELMRCQRYYEKGRYYTDAPIHRDGLLDGRTLGYQTFKIDKAAVPTISMTKVYITLEHQPTTGAGNSGNDTANWTVGGSAGSRTDGFAITHVRGTDQTTYNLVNIEDTWEAEV